jgi:hypothetical protein
MAAMAIGPVFDAIAASADAAAAAAGAGAAAAGGAGLLDLGTTLALPSVGAAAGDIGAATLPAVAGAGLTAEQLGVGAADIAAGVSGGGALGGGLGGAASPLAALGGGGSPLATLGGQGITTVPTVSTQLGGAGAAGGGGSGAASAAASAAPAGVAPSAGDVTSVFDPAATQFGPSPTGFSLPGAANVPAGLTTAPTGGATEVSPISSDIFTSAGSPPPPSPMGIDIPSSNIVGELPMGGQPGIGPFLHTSPAMGGLPDRFYAPGFIPTPQGGYGMLAGPLTPGEAGSSALGQFGAPDVGASASTLPAGVGGVSDVGTVGYVDPAYGSLVPGAPAGPPSADVFASETSAASQLSQLTPAGVLQPGVGLPDYGTMQFQTAFGDFGPSPLAPTDAQIAAQGGLPSSGIQDVAGLQTTPAVDPAFAPSVTSGLTNLEGATTGMEHWATDFAGPAGPTQVATSAVGPDATLAGTGDLRVLNATRGIADPALAYNPNGPTMPGAETASALVPGGGDPAIAYSAPPGSVPAVGGPDVAAAPVTAPAVAPQAPAVAGGTNVDGTIAQDFAVASNPNLTPAAGGGAGSFLSGVMKNPAALLAGGGLALDVLRGNQNPPGYAQIQSQAEQAAQQGKQMQGYLTSGTLPPGLQTSLDTARENAEATIRSQYAARGMSGSSAELQDIQNLHNRIVSQGSDMALQLFQQGLSETEISTRLYEVIMNQQIAQDQALSQGITNMVTALAGMSRPLAAAA